MPYYPSANITLNDLVKQYALNTASAQAIDPTTQAVIDSWDTATRTKLRQYIFDCSEALANEWDRVFVPFYAAYTVRPSMSEIWCDWRLQNGFLAFYFQSLAYADCLELDSVSIDGTNQDTGTYRLESQAPYEYVVFSSVGAMPSSSSFDSSAIFSGTWGYHRSPESMWRAIGSLQAGIDADDTSFVATDATVSLFEVYQYLKIDNEILFVTNVDSDTPYTITVERGKNGTTAASHLSAASIASYQQMPSVIRETRRRVINLASNDAELAQIVQLGESATEGGETPMQLAIPKRWTVRAV